MDGYLVKPVSIERLRSTLERWLPIQSEPHVASSADETNSSAAIDGMYLRLGWRTTVILWMSC